MTVESIAPEVRLFLAQVQRALADLDPDEVREMTDGLEADLSELVAERGPGALGSPVEYAGELRAAAGLLPRTRTARRPVRGWIDARLDAGHAFFDRLIAALPLDVRPLLEWARPLWWIARGWLWVELLDISWHAANQPWRQEFAWEPNLRGLGWLVLAATVVGSVTLGLRREQWRPRVGTIGRIALLGLNLAAIVAVVAVYDRLPQRDRAWEQGYSQGRHDASVSAANAGGPTPIQQQAGIYSDGHWVSNIYAYDASGKPLVGVQLFDQLGRPLNVVRGPECPDNNGAGTWSVVGRGSPSLQGTCLENGGGGQARVSYPWTNGAAQLDNVYPLPTRLQDTFASDPNAFTSSTPPSIGPFPMASAPTVSLPGITPSVQQPPAAPHKKATK